MSIINDLEKYRKYQCDICKSKETYFDKRKQAFKWYKTLVVSEAGFWCSRCYKSVHAQLKNPATVRKARW